jgi:hypothetical protein
MNVSLCDHHDEILRIEIYLLIFLILRGEANKPLTGLMEVARSLAFKHLTEERRILSDLKARVFGRQKNEKRTFS